MRRKAAAATQKLASALAELRDQLMNNATLAAADAVKACGMQNCLTSPYIMQQLLLMSVDRRGLERGRNEIKSGGSAFAIVSLSLSATTGAIPLSAAQSSSAAVHATRLLNAARSAAGVRTLLRESFDKWRCFVSTTLPFQQYWNSHYYPRTMRQPINVN